MIAQILPVIHGLVAAALALVFLWIGTVVADKFHLPFFHGWALAHGVIFLLFPIYFVISYLMLLPLAQYLRRINPETQDLPRRPSMLAVASLVLSCSGLLIPVIGSVLGVVAGHIARHQIRKDPELTGAGFALGGLVLGYFCLATIAGLLCVALIAALTK